MSSNTYCPTCDRYIDLSLPQFVRSLTELSNNHPQLSRETGVRGQQLSRFGSGRSLK